MFCSCLCYKNVAYSFNSVDAVDSYEGEDEHHDNVPNKLVFDNDSHAALASAMDNYDNHDDARDYDDSAAAVADNGCDGFDGD
ncbi:hypothetical protein DPMN_073983 [Dreissena polymorpha]|uniref:Uncharacterized protein n=1 Tax=Dreissena polymorpha TaxID=45954 RepID=A0A9D3YFE6_DREPO|nr:hypothetical protein DPMN_073983 [Dreissena polymorpha]